MKVSVNSISLAIALLLALELTFNGINAHDNDFKATDNDFKANDDKNHDNDNKAHDNDNKAHDNDNKAHDNDDYTNYSAHNYNSTIFFRLSFWTYLSK
uniref:Uncharacterized protein n=1 Tax=Globodera rostochiensis TaxID=31243 RepID=A0A914IH16_GLORO